MSDSETRPAGRSLLAGMLTVGTIGFGGGSALIPVMEKTLVQSRRLLDDPTFTRHTIVANITPGALPVKLASFAGQTARGPLLALIAAITVAVPGVLGTLALLATADALGPAGVRIISNASVGIAAFIIVLLIGYIWKVHSHAGHRLWRYVAITVLAALVTGGNTIVQVVALFFGLDVDPHLPHLNAVQLIVVALVVIAVVAIVRDRVAGHHRHRRAVPKPDLAPTWRATAAFVGLMVAGALPFVVLGGADGGRLAGLLALSTVTSFGGGEAYIGVADGFFVRPGLVDQSIFYTQLVPIANALPGPILVKVGSGVGFLFGQSLGTGQAWLLGASALAVTVGACCAVAIPVLGLYETLRDHPVVVSIGNYILPVICGLLVSVSATMLEVSAGVGADAGVAAPPLLWISLVAIVVMTWLHLRKIVPDLVMLLVAGMISLVALGL